MTERGILVSRILVALDSGTTVSAGLEVAAELAGRLRAELQGLFVEDGDLLQVAALPFTTQVNLMTGGSLPLESADLELQMARLASAARRRLSAAAERGHVPWSFRIVRGRIAQEVAAAAETVDLVIVEGGLHRGPVLARLGLPARTTIQNLRRPVLVLRAGRHLTGPVAVVFDGTEIGEKALQLADILTPDNNALTILFPEANPENRQALEARARELLGPAGNAAHFRTLRAASLPALCEAAHGQKAGLLVLGADSPLLPRSNAAEILDSLDCPVLLVR
ncbi:MAG: universal stress protein [Alphaproteobacteria bacterium]